MIKELVTDLDILSKKTKVFNVLEDGQKLSIELVQNLCDTLESLGDRLWLSANQIGYDVQAFAIKFNDETEVFMNPAIQAKSKAIIFREKDFYDNKEYFIPRFTEITLVFQDCLGKNKAIKFNEAASIIICQALDMLNGVMPHDYGLEIIPEFDQATKEEQEEVLAAYVKSLSELYNELDKDLLSSDIKEIWQGSKFISAVNSGEVKLEEPPMSNRKKKRLKKWLKSLGRKVKWN